MKSVKALMLGVNLFIVAAVTAVIGFTARNSLQNQITTSLDVYKKTLYEGYDNAVKYQVQGVISLLNGIYKAQEAGEVTEGEAREKAIRSVKSLRYGDDGSGYFWIDDLDYILIAHPILEEQEGNNRYNLEDKNGVNIIQEIIKTVQSDEEGGFNEFYYTKSDGVTVAPKRAYSMLFEPWGWIISSGNYIDDITEVYAVQEKQMEGKLKKQIETINLCVAIMFIAAIIITMAYAQIFIKPLRKIRDLAERLSKCDFSEPSGIKSRNEFGQTAKTLDYAQDILKSYIYDISRMLHEMADGNFEVHSEADYEGEFVEIHNSLKTIVNSMNSTLLNINGVAEHVSLSSEQMSYGSQQLAQATMEQAEGIQDVSDRMAEIARRAQKNSQNAAVAKERVLRSEQHTITGMKMMEELLSAINDISEASDNIGKIIKNIDDISSQTNILALNAAVEAARAGEAGKGFAVVAEEVRNLAQKSGSSASTTHELINNCTSAVNKGTVIAEDTGKALAAIVEENKILHNLVVEIAEDSKSQADASVYINEQIGAISIATQTNSATVEQSAASSEKLSHQAGIMKELVGKFNIREQRND